QINTHTLHEQNQIKIAVHREDATTQSGDLLRRPRLPLPDAGVDGHVGARSREFHRESAADTPSAPGTGHQRDTAIKCTHGATVPLCVAGAGGGLELFQANLDAAETPDLVGRVWTTAGRPDRPPRPDVHLPVGFTAANH
ncbi:MAG: hypothetical protein QOI08_2408, partial [Actinomycetota bacterium]|nr:hypothetical protein [Actinomycetota bacterium]